MPKQRYVRMAGGIETRGTRVANPQVYPDIALRPKGELIAPVLSFAVVAGNPLIMEYSEELDDGFVPATTDFAVVKNGGAAAITSVAVVGTTVKLTMTVAIVQGDTLTVAYTRPTANTRLRDLRGNEVASFTAQTVLNYTAGAADTTVPRFSFAVVNTTTIRMIYDEQLDTGSVPATTAFSVVVNGAAGVNPTNVAINGDTVSLTITAVISTDTVTVAYTAPGSNMLQDLAGNDAANLGAQTCINVTNFADATAPRLSRIYGSGTSIVLDYDEALTENSPTLTAFAVVVNGSGATESAVVVSGSVVTITIATGLVPGDTFTVAYTAGAVKVQDLAGNLAANFGATAGSNLSLDTQAPRLSYISGQGTSIKLHYDEPLTENTPTLSAFAVVVGGVGATETAVTVLGHIVDITISVALVSTDTFTVAYTAGATPIEDRAGNNAANFGAIAGNNITDVTVGGTPSTQSFGDSPTTGTGPPPAGTHGHGMPLPSDVQVFTSTGTWTKPAGAKLVLVQIWGAGGGGGGGRGGAAGAARSGGGGGGGGAFAEKLYDPSALGATETVTVGAGGAVGTGGSSADGSAGGTGGTTDFGTHLYVFGGAGGNGGPASGVGTRGGGGGGTASAGSAATGGNPTASGGSTGGAVGGGGGSTDVDANGAGAEYGGGAGAGAAATTGKSGGRSLHGPTGGGGGGGVSAANAQAAGGPSGAFQGWGSGGGNAGGGAGGSAGTAGTSRTGTGKAGNGGGGGGGNSGGTGGVGGAGGAPGGGGGGGGGGTTVGGDGGLGGRGEVIVTTWL